MVPATKETSLRLVIASPHARVESLVEHVRQMLPGHGVFTIKAKEDLCLERLSELRPDIIFFPHWSWLIPKEIFERYQCIIFHMTDLPYGRGGSPLQNLIVRGFKETKVSAIRCVEGLDSGPIYCKAPLSLEGTAEEILKRAATVMGGMIVWIVERLPTPTPQSGVVVNFKRRRPQDGDVVNLETLEQVYDYIRMLDAEGYPPAFLQTPLLRFDFSQAHWEGDCLEARVRIVRKTDG
jgi:methionyl-tRNA formyltransferase